MHHENLRPKRPEVSVALLARVSKHIIEARNLRIERVDLPSVLSIAMFLKMCKPNFEELCLGVDSF